MGEMPGVTVREVVFSREYLQGVRNSVDGISESRLGFCRYSQNLSTWYVSERTNRVMVGLNVYNDEMIVGFRENVFDSPSLYFFHSPFLVLGDPHAPFQDYMGEYDLFIGADRSGIEDSRWDSQYQGQVEAEASLITPLSNRPIYSGQRILTSPIPGSGVRGTVGFRVRCVRTNDVGFMTAYHVVSDSNRVYLSNFSFRVDSWRRNNHFMDMAFIATVPNVELVNSIMQTGQVLNSAVWAESDFIVGAPMQMAGAQTQGISLGLILEVNVAQSFSGGSRIHGLVRTSARMFGGDSGGPVFGLNGTTKGIMIGGILGWTHSYFVPAERSLRQLGVVRY
jgi:hypothetical protein